MGVSVAVSVIPVYIPAEHHRLDTHCPAHPSTVDWSPVAASPNKVQLHAFLATRLQNRSSRYIVKSSIYIVTVVKYQARCLTLAPVANPFFGRPFASVNILASVLFCFGRSPP